MWTRQQAIDELNYWNDSRVMTSMMSSYWKYIRKDGFKAIIQFDESFWEHLIEQELVTESHSDHMDRVLKLPGEWIICEMCSGHGKVVNPSIDAGGYSPDDRYYYDDYDDYHSGMYDISCPTCKGDGKNFYPVFPEAIAKELDEWIEEDRRYHAECAAERMMGA